MTSKKKSIAKKKAVPKPKHARFFLFNIKLLSNTREGEMAYLDLFRYLHLKKVIADVQHDKQMILRTQFSKVVRRQTVLYGKISRFTKLTGKDWINLENFEIENVDIPKNRFPNLKETDYIFVPSAHRFAILKSADVGLSSANAFLKAALKKATDVGEQYDVYLEQSSDVFEQILEAEAIERLHIEISYTNDDIVEGAEEWMDQILKQAGIKNFTIDATADQNQNISIENQILSGALALAKSNGKAKARIVEKNKRRTVITEDHPEDFQVSYKNPDEKVDSIAAKIINEFRDG